MGTRSNIALQEEDGSIEMIYCHWDGYPSYTGSVLLKHYNSEEAARALIAIGDLSSLRERLAPAEGESHTYDKSVDDVTVAYHRDRGDHWEDVEPLKFKNMREARESSGGDYIYVFDVEKGRWFIGDGEYGLEELTPKICKMK